MLVDRIGFMQGRLTDKGGFYPQKFPFECWEKEFEAAADIGFACMEWMFNFEQSEKNPVIHEEGIKKICNVIEKTGVFISGICANYFMQRSIYDTYRWEDNLSILLRLAEAAERMKCPNIIIPLFEASEIRLGNDTFEKILGKISEKDVRILLETDCEMETLCGRLEDGTYENAGLCYDIGNAAGYGKDIVRELKQYAHYVGNIHLKDKKRQGSTVMLGSGDAPFEEVFETLREKQYQGCFILESYYDVNAVEDTKKNYRYIKDLLKK